MYIVFSTPTMLDLKLLTVLGVSVKEKENAFGKFGTGLKYGLSILARDNIETVVLIDGEKYVLNTVADKFRDKDFDVVCLNDMQLPFCTNYGLNWKLEDAYREFASNTSDENGEIAIFETDDYDAVVEQLYSGGTHIIVQSSDMCRIHEQDHILLDPNIEKLVDGYSLDVMQRPEKMDPKNIYFQGVLAGKYEHPAMFLYNIKNNSVTLSEDRKVASESQVLNQIKYFYVSGCENEDLLRAVMTNQRESKFLEHAIRYKDSYLTPSETFLRIAFELYYKRELAPCFEAVIKESYSSGTISKLARAPESVILAKVQKTVEFILMQFDNHIERDKLNKLEVRVTDNNKLSQIKAMIVAEDNVLLIHESIIGLDDKGMLLAFLPVILNYAEKHNLLAVLWAEESEEVYKMYCNNWIAETFQKDVLVLGVKAETKEKEEDID